MKKPKTPSKKKAVKVKAHRRRRAKALPPRDGKGRFRRKLGPLFER